MENNPSKVQKKHATAYKLGNKFVLHSDAITTSGLGITSEPFLTLAGNASYTEIGKAIQLMGFEFCTSIYNIKMDTTSEVAPI